MSMVDITALTKGPLLMFAIDYAIENGEGVNPKGGIAEIVRIFEKVRGQIEQDVKLFQALRCYADASAQAKIRSSIYSPQSELVISAAEQTIFTELSALFKQMEPLSRTSRKRLAPAEKEKLPPTKISKDVQTLTEDLWETSDDEDGVGKEMILSDWSSDSDSSSQLSETVLVNW